MNLLAPILFMTLMVTVLACATLDRRRKRSPAGMVPVSVIVPCFNDGATVEATLRSVFASWPEHLLEVMAINDCSRDDSLAGIERVAREHAVRVIDNKVNMGKAESLNRAVAAARHELVLCLDADTLLTAEAMKDMLARLAHDRRVGAVSCPYKPVNRGFLPAMQAIEYSMLRLGQGAGNVTSTLALWGGCLMVRRAAFAEAGGFSLNAITEDVDLAFKLNRAGWKVEQSFVFVPTHVPAVWRVWVRQKMRWTAGGFQCVFKYPKVWLRNPLQMLFISSYTVLTVSGLYGIAADTSLFSIGQYVADLVARDIPLDAVWRITSIYYGQVLAVKLLTSVGFSLFSLVYVLPTISGIRNWMRIALVVPFSVGYFPLYLLVSLLGFTFWFFRLRRVSHGERAW